MRIALVAAVCLASFASACSPQAPKPEANADAAAASTCPDDGPRFPGTGLCTGRISNYFDPEVLAVPVSTPPEGCEWTFNETMMAGGEEAILYRALSCKGVTTQLEYGGGAHSAVLTIARSAYDTTPPPADAEQQEVAHIWVSDPAEPQKVIRDLIAAAPKAEQPKCEVQLANREGWPKDALVIGYNAKAAKSLSKTEPNAVCGPWGLNEDETTYWRIKQGYAWHFMLGQDDPGFDAPSILLMRKDADGNWAVVN